MASKDDALEFKVLGHIQGVDEVLRAAHNLQLQVNALEAAIANLTVEMEVE